MKSSIWAITCVVLLSYAFVGCGREETVRVSEQPKDTSEAKPPSPGPMGAMPLATQPRGASADGIAWTLPSGWKEDPTPRPMREATLIAAEGDNGAQVIISRLSSSFGDFTANVNRWRGQVDLDPLTDSSATKPEVISTSVGEAKLLKMDGPEKSQIVVILSRGDSTWFFRMIGAKQVVAQNEAKLRQMISSLKENQ